MEKIICKNCGSDNKSSYKYCYSCGYELPKIEPIEVEDKNEQLPKKKNRKKNLIGTIVGTAAFCLTYFAVQHIFFSPPSIDQVLMKTASEINKSCPIMVDQFTRLDNAVALSNDTFQYNYSIVNDEKAEINLDTAKKYIEPELLNRVKTDPDLKYFRDNKITMVYKYRDKNGVFVVKYTITPEMYKE